MTHYRTYKQPKPVIGPCGHKFIKEGIKPYHPYCSPQCFLKFKTGKVELDDSQLSQLKLPRLKDIAKGVFCDYIKLRDKDQPEITSGEMEKKGDKMNGGHLYSCERVPGLMFDEDNCFKQSEFFNLQMNDENIFRETSENVRRRIGSERFQSLVDKAQSSFMRNYKYSRDEYIDYIKTYSQKIKMFNTKSEEVK